MNNKIRNQKSINAQRLMTRREAMMECGRMAVAGVLTAMGSFLLIRKRNPAKGRQICISKGICSGCRVFDDCVLPQALSRKANDE